MVSTTIAGLDKVLAAGIDAGESIPQLTQRVQGYTGFNKNRAQKIARSETIRASGKANIMAWNQSGVVVKQIWYTALDERVCEICEFLHGKVVSINKVFLSAEGLVAIGGDSYEPLQSPPAHPQCRCTLLPEIES
jgi:SPP1 gp7 family putative phage head morphogenesis protein